MNILDIIKGHYNEYINDNEDLSNARLEICKECPLYKETSMGPICNPQLFINNEGEISQVKRQGYVRGCACRLNAKTRLTYAKCIVGKW